MKNRVSEDILNRLGGIPDQLMNLGFLAERRERCVTAEEYRREIAFYEQPELRDKKRFFSIPESAAELVTQSRKKFLDGEEILFRYPSRYVPRNPAVAPRFLAHTENRDGYLFLWRHSPAGLTTASSRESPNAHGGEAKGAIRPLVLCVHGFRMGSPKRAMAMFKVRKLFSMGMDVALFIQPHHWKRAGSGFRQNFFIGEDLPLTIENIGQQVHDLHACFLALQKTGYERIGLIGGSLGGLAVTLHATLSDAPEFVFSVVPAIRMDAHLDPARSALPFTVDEDLREASFRALDLVDPSFYAPRIDLDHFGVVYHKGDRINAASATEAWIQRWHLQHVTALAGGHWVVFDGKARGAAWYGWLRRFGFIP